MYGGEENEAQRIHSTAGEKRMRELAKDPMLDAILCAECPKEFVPKRKGQTTCGTPSCSGGQGARARNYRAKKLPGGKKARR